ncbi:aldo/keto reductase [Waterburya agarophytonicola K14]|uniref:Aldo/keto reductase n=1 Tax=Waterburya agarophytonicola KI4 TaxID=2874699 RepID=A0A964BNH3_9CYAN|nr:aldo/keto reductase [Waterburya agarophytonicola]MCC0176673.1 aldo/keto reductase [Waterburya agarophytonicola KI4]
MQYRRFGRTELQMPVFSCGGMRYQYKWQDLPQSEIPEANQHNLEATIHRAFDLGINHIETARGYGSSEMQLGQVLPHLPREKLIFQTKVSPKSDPLEFRRQFQQSLNFCQLEYVDLLGLHGINNEETLHNSVRPGGCLDEARKLQAEGKVRHIGFSTHGSTKIITKAIETGEFDYVNLHWYYINQWNWSAIEAAKRHDMGVFIISPSDKGGHLYNPPPKLVELCQPLSPMVFNDLFCLSHPEVHTLSLGASKPSDFDEHLKVLSLLDRADRILPPILERLEQAAIAVLGKDWLENWQKGLPSHEDTPNNVNIQVILWLRNLALAYDMIEYGQARYNLLTNGGHWFPGNKANNVAQLDFNSCLSASPYKKEIPKLLAETDGILGGAPVQRLSQS